MRYDHVAEDNLFNEMAACLMINHFPVYIVQREKEVVREENAVLVQLECRIRRGKRTVALYKRDGWVVSYHETAMSFIKVIRSVINCNRAMYDAYRKASSNA